MMRKLIVVGGCLLFFFLGWAFGQGISRGLNGSLWSNSTRFDPDLQGMYVTGFLQGYLASWTSEPGIETAHRGLTSPNTKAPMKKLSTFDLARSKKVRDDLTGGGSNQNLARSEIADGISTFYSDFRNQPVCWKDALEFTVMSLNGDAPTDQELDAARKDDASDGCK